MNAIPFLCSAPVRYTLAVAAVAVAFTVQTALSTWIGSSLPPFIMFYPTVMVVVLFTGLGPGVLATVVTLAVVNVWIMPPVGQFSIHPPVALLSLVLFAFNGSLICTVTELYRRNRGKAAAYDREVAMRENQATLRSFYNSAPFLMGVAELDGDRTMAVSGNRAAAEFFATRPEDLQGKTGIALGNPAEIERLWVENYRRCQRDGAPVHFDYEHPRAAGNCWLSATVAYIGIGPTGKPRFSFVVEDITGRKRLEAERQKFISLADQSTEFIGMCDMNFKPFYVNTAGQRLVGLDSLEHACSVRVQDYFFPEDQPYITDEFFPKVLREGQSEVEIRFRHFKTGAALWMICNVFQVRGEDGQVVGYATVSRNITERKEAEEKLRESEHRLRAFLENSAIIGWLKDEDGRHVYLSENYQRRIGVRLEDWRGKTDFEVWPREIAEEFRRNDLSVLATDQPIEVVECTTDKDGKKTWWLNHKFTFRDAAGRRYIGGLGVDVTERKEAEAKLHESEEKYRTLFESIDQGFCIIEVLFDEHEKPVDYRFLLVNPAFERQTGIKDATGRRMREIAPLHEEHWFQIYGKITLTDEAQRFENLAAQLHCYYDVFAWRVGEPAERKVAILFNDITGRRQMEENIKHMALHDALTSLPNRTLFNDRLTLALAHAHRKGEKLAVLFLDLDKFKVINDTLGHTIGDQLLQGVADKLKNSLREDDTIARLGGDEFALLLPGIAHTRDVIAIAETILEVFKEPWMIYRHELFITASIGIALYPEDGENAENLLKHADTAMYHAKEQGRNNYQFYTPAMYFKSMEKMTLESNLRRALDREEFLVCYQPFVNTNTGQVANVEALVRWRHPDWGMTSPEKFLALSENTRLIIFIDELVLYTACEQCKAWYDMGSQSIRVAVNISAQTFQQPNLVETISFVLQKTGLDPHFLGLEITESTAMENIETTICKMHKLRDMGIQIAIDDFGTGFSSLSYLKKFPISKLKISQHFVKGIANDERDRAIVELIIALAQSLKLKVVAEGVETEEQFIFLKQRKCDEIQGYLFCNPLPAEAFEKTLIQNAHLFG